MSLPWEVGFWGGKSQGKMGLQCGNADLFLFASYWARHLRASVSMIKKNGNLLSANSSQFLADEWSWLCSTEG